MSLGNSKYTYFTLRDAGPDEFKAEVDRFVKEVDNEISTLSVESPKKRARFDVSQESGYGSQSQPRIWTQSGVILQVKLENFLCHDKFNITLNNRLNFIVGRNGSGKSAILTGIIVALGANANVTGRGTSLKDFVKHNCQSARVTVIVSNAGPLNFRREQYGNRIIVVRTIDNQGRSKVELKTEQGKTLSTKMQDLRGMCLKLGIQVDNPISVLDQNTAKTLLIQNKPAGLYHLFMKATHLDNLKHLHEEIERLQRQTDQEIQKKTRDLENNNAEVVEAKRKYEILKSFEKDKEKEDLLKLELLRAQAKDCFIDLDNAQNLLKDAVAKRLCLEKLLSNNESDILLQQLEEETNNVRELVNQQEEVENNLKTVKTRCSDSLKEEKNCALDLKNLKIKMQHNEHMIEDFKGEIISLQKKLQPSHTEMKKKREEEMSILLQTLKQYEDLKVESSGKLLNLQESLSNKTEELAELRAQEKTLQKALVEKKKALQGLEEDGSNFSRFGPCMSKLIELIEQNSKAGKFKRKPVGPLGSFVRVKDPKWVLAVESAIKHRINNFVVEYWEDEKLLLTIIKSTCTHGPKPGVVRCRLIEKPIDTSMTAVRTANYPNILDMIEVNNTIVHNILLELFRIESTLLIPTDDECYYLLKDVQTVPKNCFKAFTLAGASYLPAPNYSTYCASQREARILEVSQQALIEGMHHTITKFEDQLKDIKQKSNSALFEVQNLKEHIKETRMANSKNMEKFLEAKNKLEKLKDAEMADTHSISTLKEDLSERERRQLEYKSMLEKLVEKLETLQTEKRQLISKGKEYKERLDNLEKQKQPLIMKQKTINNELETLKSSQTNSATRIDHMKKQEEQHASLIKKLEGTCTQRNQDAQKFESHLLSEGVNLEEISNAERNLETIDAELKTIMKRRASVAKSFGKNIVDVEREFHDIFAVHEEVENKINILKKNSVTLKEAVENRLNLYITQRRYIACVVSHQFTRVLLQRNCIGSIKVNFNEKSLVINVGPIDTGDKTGRGTASLSGGERSYATSAFVIALWNVTELPFYYLDEFDVFMDPVVRQTVVNHLVKFARLKRGFQFGFLTPNGTDIKEASDLSIWRLQDPRES